MTDEKPIVPVSTIASVSATGSFDGLMIQTSSSDSAQATPGIVPDPILHGSGSAEIEISSLTGPEPQFPLDPVASELDEVFILPGLDVHTKAVSQSTTRDITSSSQSDSVSLDDYESTHSSLPIILLASYASAVTIALIWVLVSGRTIVGPTDIFHPTQMGPESSRRGKVSATLEPAAKIPLTRVTTLGKLLRVGNLEIIPIEVSRGPVSLRKIRDLDEYRDGGADALQIRLRLRNTSNNLVFAPLDESYIRDRDRGAPDSFIQVGSSERIYLYPLAVESEWSIVGQSFPTLNPDETAETTTHKTP